MEAETLICRRCKIEKSLSEYYTRSGLPHLHLKMCKACYRELGRSQVHSSADRRRAVVQSEKEVIEILKGQGIPALPGKALGHQYADIIAWGCVLIEVKYSRIRNNNLFIFSFSPQQRNYSIRGDLVVLVCDYGDKITHHVFLSSDPVFYFKSGSLKPSTCYMPYAKQRRNFANRITLMPEYMEAHQGKWDMVEDVRLNVKEFLLTESASLAKKLKYLDAPDPRVLTHRYQRLGKRLINRSAQIFRSRLDKQRSGEAASLCKKCTSCPEAGFESRTRKSLPVGRGGLQTLLSSAQLKNLMS